MKLTTRQLRDLGSYMGSQVKYWLPSFPNQVTTARITPSWLCFIDDHNTDPSLSTDPKYVTEYRVLLRSIMNMTDEEAVRLYLIEIESPNLHVGPEEMRLYKVERTDWRIVIDGRVGISSFGRIYNGYKSDLPYNTPASHAYLQEIGIYVPGKIEEKYVELINPSSNESDNNTR